MAGKTLEESWKSQPWTSSDDGDFEEYRNRKGKVLPGYNPTDPYESANRSARYLSEQSNATAQMEEQAETEFEKVATEEKRLKPMAEDEPQYADEANPELAGMDQLEPVDDDPEVAMQRRKRLAVAQQKSADLEQLHKELNEKLDAALVAEEQRSKSLYQIENTKKNTMDYARDVYGDEADLDYISNSANGAKYEASKPSKQLMKDVKEKVEEIQEESKKVNMLTPSGEVREMDPDVADAMVAYTGKSHDGLLEKAAAGLTAGIDELTQQTEANDRKAETKYENFEFTRDEEAKLKALQEKIAENDKEAQRFEEIAPDSMSQEEYNEFNRERRFREYGDPSRNVDFQYVMTKEGVYEWNGRPLPSAMSSPTMVREMEKQGQYEGPEVG